MDYSLADVASAVRNNDNDNEFGGGAWWIIVLFLFAFMGNGFGNKSNADPVTEAGLCNAMNFNNLENTVGRLSDLTQNQTMTLGAAITNTAKDIAVGQASLQQQMTGVVKYPMNFGYNAGTNPFCHQTTTTPTTTG